MARDRPRPPDGRLPLRSNPETRMISSRRTPDRRRRALPLQFEALEPRSTPTTLPAGFTEAAIATGLSRPTAMEFAPDGRLFVLEQAGYVELVRSDGTTWTALHLDVD